MGVTGLWKLIEPCGKPVPVETLEGKILAVDISIWLHQVVKGFQDNKGSALSNAHLLGLFHRLCKLLYYRVRPVFIFDGCVPQLKRDTIARRQQQRNKLSNEADRIQALLLQSLAKEKVVQQALGASAEQLLLKSPAKRPPASKSKNDEDDIFKLPDLPVAASAGAAMDDSSDQDLDDTSASATSDSSFDESTARRTYDSSLQAIDVKSQHFRNLPADVRHEILTDIKETRKQSSWGRLHELPARSDDFSSFQMKRLLKRRAVQESLEKAEEEMGGHTLTYTELCNFFNEEGIVTPTAIEQSTRQISSDEHTRFLLVRDLKKKALESAEIKTETKCETIKEEAPVADIDDEKPSTSRHVVEAEEKKPIDQLGTEYDEDYAKAIALSLEETSIVYNEKDYAYNSDQDLRLNREQSKQLRHAAKGPARAYMIEYGGMNDEEVGNIMETTQFNNTQSLERHFEESQKEALKELNKNSASHVEEIVDSDTDSDLEEVQVDNNLEIRVDVNTTLKPADDIFSDVFDKSDNDDGFIEVPNDPKVESSKETAEANLTEETESLKGTSKTKLTDNEEFLKESKEAELTDTEIIDVKDREEQDLLDKTENKPQTSNINSILADLKKQTEEVKNIKLDSSSEEKLKNGLSSILDDLKKQTHDVKSIKLEQIKLSDGNIIELSSDDETKPSKVDEIIELGDDNQSKRISPNKTPSKNKSITDYFETSYVVKRTPDKSPLNDVTPPGTPKVPKPFYRKRTPKSGQKRSAEESSDDGLTPNKISSKAAKSLFEQGDQESELMPKPLDPEDLIKDAADALKSQKTSEELQTMANSLAQERKQLELERNRQDRMGMSISQRMSIDCQELLRLFGIPYIVAPMEAEAQCAFLNATELTNGTITDDSDIWLFGGRTVYKNFFAQNKHVLEFRSEQIEQTFNCNRGKLIQLACLVGSDYTTGIHGIGAVTALEILASFSTATTVPATHSICNQTVLETLTRFRDWWQAHKNSNLPPGSSARLSLRKKLKNIELHEGFPSTAVVEAYLDPKVDDNREAFTWGTPDVDSIREFARKSFGWTTSKTDDILMPVIKKINDKKIQGSIRNYFTAKSALRVQQPQVSKRVQTAIDKMSGKLDVETPEKPKKATRARRTKAVNKESNDVEVDPKLTRPKRGKRKSTTTTEAATIEEGVNTENPSTSQSSSIKPSKCPRIPNSSEVIPQRERDLEQMRLNKAKAAELFKKAAKN
ncbi:LOW QUALITY PROTEIN: DNA excision repair protein ERCC-5 [Drosophila tropicalis]|uniref:LOW QUALITY PROTEIN: DNA excision repair protein ERCC-5 n=1 Tax=Drosophila tropicalis TaxID=46794 RepID=UPI0035AC07B9